MSGDDEGTAAPKLDVEKSCRSIAQFPAKDAESYRAMQRRFEEMMECILAPQTYVPMEGAVETAALAEQTELGRELSVYAEKTPEEIVCELFEDDHVRTLMLYMACHWGLEYDQPGVSYMVPIYLVRGSYEQGAHQSLQMGSLRPNPDCSQYRTPIPRLYLGGASVAPGGMVIFGPGYNCSNAIAEDFGLEKWWSEPEFVPAARAGGFIP